MVIMERIGAAEQGVSVAAADDTAALNRVAVTVKDLEVARRALSGLAGNLRWDSSARRAALAADFDTDNGSVAAIDARLIALRKWQDLYDPQRRIAWPHLIDAAAIATLVGTDHGIGFDNAKFGELVEFVAELPW